ADFTAVFPVADNSCRAPDRTLHSLWAFDLIFKRMNGEKAMRTKARNRIVAVAAALTACAGHAAAAEITWKASIWGERRSSSEPIEWYAKEVAAKTGGRMKIDVAYDANAKA